MTTILKVGSKFAIAERRERGFLRILFGKWDFWRDFVYDHELEFDSMADAEEYMHKNKPSIPVVVAEYVN